MIWQTSVFYTVSKVSMRALDEMIDSEDILFQAICT